MRVKRSIAPGRIAPALGLSVALLFAGVGQGVFVSGAPAQASSARIPVQSAQAPAGLTVSLAVQTGSGNPAVVFNGERITYTISAQNTGPGALTNVKVLNGLPEKTLDDIACAPDCHQTFVPQQFKDPLGEIIIVTRTTAVDWTVASLPAGQTRQFVVSGRVGGKADGVQFTNQAVVEADGLSPVPTNAVQTTVRLRIRDTGDAQVSSAATWLSADLGGTIGQDWGDFDRDGLLDLALGSSSGAAVYRNANGVLESFWTTSQQTYGVVWADLDADGILELVTVGNSQDGTAVTPGLNHIYRYNAAQSTFVLSATLASDWQLVRIAAGDFNRDGLVDLIGSTNAINAPCPVVMYRNLGNLSFAPAQCVSQRATAAVGVGDYNNDDWPDLALGAFPNQVILLINRMNLPGEFFSPPVVIDPNTTFLPYDFTWGDYDGDGYFDLAAAFPLQREARIYRNLAGQGWELPPGNVIPTRVFMTPLSVDWADFNGDSWIDLAVADSPPRLYWWDYDGRFSLIDGLSVGAVGGQVWGVRGVQTRPNGPLDLSLANRDRSSMVFNVVAPRLLKNRYLIDTTPSTVRAGAIALGDVNGDGQVDAVLGAAVGSFGGRVYLNQAGAFIAGNSLGVGSGPQSMAFADVDADGRLEVGVATAVDVRVHLGSGAVLSQVVVPAGGPYVLAWGDINGDGWLDLAVGSNGPVYVYLNDRGRLLNSPSFATAETCATSSLAWADFNSDRWQDLAVGCRSDRARVYRNSRMNTLIPAWTAPTASISGTVAWADFNGDSRPDLAVGGFGQPVRVFENVNGAISSNPIWSSPTVSRTTSIAWGDWDDDGYPELALGNDGEADQVFGNLRSAPGQPRLFWLWSSLEVSRTTGLAWGDVEGDGDLDLVVADADGLGGVYINGINTPAHHTDVFTPSLSLPHSPAYLSLRRPGRTDSAWFHSSPQLLAYFTSPTVTVPYRLFDADGSRSTAGSNAPGDRIAATRFEYSLDGGSTWQPARPDASSPPPVTITQRLGADAVFVWNARLDGAISDDARFRIQVVKQDPIGPVQKPASSVVSPPFRVRAITCYWPERPAFTWTPFNPRPGEVTQFVGVISGGSGPITYTWDFGDGRPARTGQIVQVTFTLTNTYQVQLAVTGAPCPQTREVITTAMVRVGSGIPPARLYLPVVARQSSGPVALSADTALLDPSGARAPSDDRSDERAQTDRITLLDGDADPAAGVTRLRWAAPEGQPAGYRVYRMGPGDTTPQALATLPADATTYVDDAPGAVCDTSYFVTVLWEAGARESAPSATSFRSPPCAGPAPQSSLQPNLIASVKEGVPVTGQSVTGQSVTGQSAAGSPVSGQRPAVWRRAANAAAPTALAPLVASGAQQAALAVCDALTVTQSGISGQPDVAQAARRVAFWSTGAFDPAAGNVDGNIEVFVYDADALRFTQVTSSAGSILGGFNLWPTLSEDGMKLAFASDRSLIPGGNPDGNFEVFVAVLSSTGVLELGQVTTTTIGANTAPAISADGRAIAFVSDRNLVGNNADNNAEIYLAVLTGTRVLTYVQVSQSTGVVNDAPAISRDGGRVVFAQRSSGSAGDVVTVWLSATQIISIGIAGGNVDPQPVISADGSRVVFVSDRDLVAGSNPAGLRQMFVYEVGAAQLRQITTGGVGSNCAPSISAQGERAVCAQSDTQLVLHNLSAGRALDMPQIGQQNRDPSIGGDGQTTAYAANGRIILSLCPIADLSVTKTGSPAAVLSGESLDYTIVVSNAGPGAALNVVVHDPLPGGVILPPVLTPDQTDDDDSVTGFGGGTLAAGANNVTWTTSLADDVRAGALTLATPSGNAAELPGNRAPGGWFPMTGNVLLLHLDEPASATVFTDASGLANNAVCAGADCPTRGVWAQVGRGVSFNGINQFIQAPDSVNYDFAINQDFTVMAWVSAQAIQAQTAAIDNSVIEKWNGSQGYPFAIRMYNQTSAAPGRVVALRYDRVFNPSVVSVSRIDDGQFHHIVFARRAGQLRLYVDGVRENTATDDTGSNAFICSLLGCDTRNNSPVYLGQRGGGTNPFSGIVDEVAIFNHALDDNDVRAIYERQAPAFGRAGVFDSRVIDAGRPVNWNRLTWMPDRPWGKELPRNNQVEAGYPSATGTVSMTGNVLLMRFNEPASATTFIDASGGNRNAACFGSSCPRAGAPGRYNTALEFDGVNDWVSVPDSNELDIRQELTLEAWVYLFDPARDQKIVGKTPIGSGYLLGVRNGRIDPEVWNDLGQQFRFPANSGPLIPAQQWTHLAVTFRAGDRMIGYVDGRPVATLTVTARPIGVNNTALRIGAAPWDGALALPGRLDEVAVYDRALTAREIAARYQRGAARVLMQARVCDDPACSGESFTGPGGSPRAFYSELLNDAAGSPSVSLSVPNNRYFQYRLWLDSRDLDVSPAVYSVTIGPPHGPASSSQGECTSVDPVVCALGTLSPHMTATVRISASVSQLAPAGVVNNVALVSSDSDDVAPGNNMYTATTTVLRSVSLSIAKLDALTVVGGAQLITYTILITNEGTSAATGVTMRDDVPADVIVTGLQAAGLSCLRSGNAVSCGPNTLGGGAVARVTIPGIANPTASGLITNTAQVSSTEFFTGSVATVTTRVRSTADVSVTLLQPAGPAIAGDWLTYTARVTNADFSIARGVILTITLPVSVTNINPGHAGCAQAGGVVVCALGDLAQSQVVDAPVGMRVEPARLTPISATALVSVDGIDTNPANNTASVTTAIEALADLIVSKRAPVSVTAGRRITYTLAYTQAGPSNAAFVTLTDALPPGVSLDGFLPHGQTPPAAFGAPISSGLTVTWTAAGLTAGATGLITFSLPVTNIAPPSLLHNTVAITAATPDPSPANNSSAFTTNVSPIAPSAVVLTLPSSSVVSGTTVFMTATVDPADVTLPLTFTWTISNHPVYTEVLISPVSVVSATWRALGPQSVSVAVENAGGSQTASGEVIVIPVAPLGVLITPPPSVISGTAAVFTATVSPVTVTLPLTYTWAAANQPLSPVSRVVSAITDVISFTWGVTGTQHVTVTAANDAGSHTDWVSVNVGP